MSDEDRQVGFLLGAGFSMAAGLPSTQKLTERLLQDNGIVSSADLRYGYNSDPWKNNQQKTQKHSQHIIEFLKMINGVLGASESVKIDYEQIFEFVQQIKFVNDPIFGNQAFQDQAAKVRAKVSAELLPITIDMVNDWDWDTLLERAIEYVRIVVGNLLKLQHSKPEAHRPFVEMLTKLKQKQVPVVSLNHDVSLLAQMKQLGVECFFGFRNSEREEVQWSPEYYPVSEEKVVYLPLHGCVYWLDTRDGVILDGHEHPARRSSWDSMLWEGEIDFPEEIILIGRESKPLVYTNSLFTHLHCFFAQRLQKVSHLVVIGYGFRDPGINTRVIPWLRQNGHRMTVIDPSVNHLRKEIWPFCMNDSDSLEDKGKLTLISEKTEDVDWTKFAF
jgi:hypothetical protein